VFREHVIKYGQRCDSITHWLVSQTPGGDHAERLRSTSSLPMQHKLGYQTRIKPTEFQYLEQQHDHLLASVQIASFASKIAGSCKEYAIV
jgi:hypothetical protein